VSSNSRLEGPKNLRARRREATRQEILTAAREVFLETGIHSARMETIAERAAVSVGTLYNYFTDRQSLLDSLYERLHDELLAALDGALEQGTQRPFPAQLLAYVTAMLTHLDTHRFIVMALFEGTAEVGRDDGTAKRRRIEQILERTSRLCERGVDGGALAAKHAALYPAMLQGLIRGIAVRAYLAQGTELRAAAAAICDLFLHGAAAGSTSHV
jgi:AcrR family transcriptional regulator